MEAEARLFLADAVREPEPAGDLLSAFISQPGRMSPSRDSKIAFCPSTTSPCSTTR
jgi:hypothetical protein